MGNWSTAPRIQNLVVTTTQRTRYGRRGQDRHLFPLPRIKPRFLGRPPQSSVTTPGGHSAKCWHGLHLTACEIVTAMGRAVAVSSFVSMSPAHALCEQGCLRQASFYNSLTHSFLHSSSAFTVRSYQFKVYDFLIICFETWSDIPYPHVLERVKRKFIMFNLLKPSGNYMYHQV